MNNVYKQQCAIRKNHRKALENGVFAVLDFGSMNISCLILHYDNKELGAFDNDIYDYAWKPRFRVIGAATYRSFGIEDGEIYNMDEAENAVRTVLIRAQKNARTRVDYAIVGFSGGDIHSDLSDGDAKVKKNIVTQQDINTVILNCQSRLNVPKDFSLLHCQPVNFMLDNRDYLYDPRGQAGDRLTVEMNSVFVRSQYINAIIRCIHKCDVEIAGLTCSAYTSALGVLTQEQKKQGCVLIDMGAQNTSISYFYRNHMCYCKNYAIGGDRITQEMSSIFKISLKMAERIKTRHGGVFDPKSIEPEDIELFETDNAFEEPCKYTSYSELAHIIREFIGAIFENVYKDLTDFGLDHAPIQQVVLTGGVANMTGIEDFAQSMLEYPVRCMLPVRTQGTPEAFYRHQHSALIGLCYFACDPQDELWDVLIPLEKKRAGLLDEILKRLV